MGMYKIINNLTYNFFCHEACQKLHLIYPYNWENNESAKKPIFQLTKDRKTAAFSITREKLGKLVMHIPTKLKSK